METSLVELFIMGFGVRYIQVYIWALSPATFVNLDHVTNISELNPQCSVGMTEYTDA